MSRASECREWLKQNPGWYFASDIFDGLGKVGWRERQPYAWRLNSEVQAGRIARLGTGKCTRYCYVSEPAGRGEHD